MLDLLGAESATQFLLTGGVVVSLLVAGYVANKDGWSRPLKLGSMVFALAFALHILPERDPGSLAGVCTTDGTTKADVLNVGTEAYQTAPRLKAPAGYVHLIYDAEHSMLFTLGFTTDISTRLEATNARMPGEIQLVALLKVDYAAEFARKLRSKYAGNEASDAWFELTIKEIREICSL